MAAFQPGPNAAVLDRRTVLKTAAASATLVEPTAAAARAPEGATSPSWSNTRSTEETGDGHRRTLSRRGSAACTKVMAGHVERGYVPGLVTLIDRRREVHVDAISGLAFGSDATDAPRHHLPYRLADQTDHRGRSDPGRGVPAAAR